MTAQRVTRILDVVSGRVIVLSGITAHVRLGQGRRGELAIQVDAAEEYRDRLRIVVDDGRWAGIGATDAMVGAAASAGAGPLTVGELASPDAAVLTEPWDPDAAPEARRRSAQLAASRAGTITVAVPPGSPALLHDCRSADVALDGGTVDATLTGSGAIRIRGTQDLTLTVAGGGAALLSEIVGTGRITASGAAAVDLAGRLERLQVVASDRATVRARGDFQEVGGAVAGRGRVDLEGQVGRMALDVFGGGSLTVNGHRLR